MNFNYLISFVKFISFWDLKKKRFNKIIQQI